jgi:membrane-associated phospholipid phosphatase
MTWTAVAIRVSAQHTGCSTGLRLLSPGPHNGRQQVAAECVLAFTGLGILCTRRQDGWVWRLDQAVSAVVARRRSVMAVRLARMVSTAAEPSVAVIPLAASAAVAARRGGWPAAIAPCLTVLTGVFIRFRLSQVIARQRPPAAIWLTEPEGFSLPSRHTCLAALTVGACARALGAGRGGTQAASLAAAASVGASRVCLGVHWPTDVLAGWLFAAGWLGLADLRRPPDLAGSGSAPASAGP